jgi:hypothetical protein
MANFTSELYLDDAESIRAALARVDGVNGDAIAARVDDADVIAEYERQRAEVRTAEGTPAHVQDKTTVSDGLVRYTAPSLLFRRGAEVAYAGGWQPLLGYDTLLANFVPELEREATPDSPEPLLELFRNGLTTAEVALLARGSDPVPDRETAATVLLELEDAGRVTRTAIGSDAVWSLRAD